ncbi:MAG: lactate utilization protein [Clostridium sp.]|uniref:lactate utilization protein n=1 Tax=Clostridium sp. TaxID=1506 RepID=UPI003045B17B
MDDNMIWLKENKIKQTINCLNSNGMNGYLVNSEEELIKKIEEITWSGATVACGGSMSLFETGVIEHLRSGRYTFLDRYKEGLTKNEVKEIYRQSFSADVYFTGTNAITEKGELYNVDGNGNRVAAMLYGPDKVIVVLGENKIVKDIDEAIRRNERIAAPANCKRLNRNTPCTKVGYCLDCSSEDRICNEYTIIRRQGNKDRIHVIFLNKELGY